MPTRPRSLRSAYMLVLAALAVVAAWHDLVPGGRDAPALAAQEDEAPARAEALGDDADELPAPMNGDSRNSWFTTATTCALCHTTSSGSVALRGEDGADVSPLHTWRATMMANSFRDPYWRAKVEHELASMPESEHAALQALCLRCHAPMALRTAELADGPPPTVASALADPLAADGVSCTLCHQIEDSALGQDASFVAGFSIPGGRPAYGPYEKPFTMPMERHSGYLAEHSPHISRAAVCGTCHTLITRSGEDAPAFLEQGPYLEWRNSIYSDEGGVTPASRTCVDCHMADVGSMRIAHNPAGGDFPRLGDRPHVRSHAVVGGNTFVLGILDEHWEPLAVVSEPEQAEGVLTATRAMLRAAAEIEIGTPERRADELVFDVKVINRTGHKLPSSYPSRRAWLRVQVEHEGRVVFDSGAHDERGHILGPKDETAEPHRDVVTAPEQVVIYEARPVDGQGRPTLLLHAMEAYGKDTRLLPAGWAAGGPDAARTRPIGTEGDASFRAGSDTVTYRVALPSGGAAPLVRAWLLYQSVPPHWIDALRPLVTPYARAFVRMADAADGTPETLASATRGE